LKLAGGTARLAPYEADKVAKPEDETLFSARQACPVCGYSVATLEPKMFSFNSPAGACPTCDGIGLKDFFGSASGRRLSTPVTRRWRHQELGSQELLLLRVDHRDGEALQVRSRNAVEDLSKKAQQVMLFGKRQ